MKIILALFLALAPLVLYSGEQKLPDLDKLLVQMDDEDFDVREEAMDALIWSFPEHYAMKFYTMSKDASLSLEVRTRLKIVAKRIVLERKVPQTEQYRRLFCLVGFSYTVQWSEYDEYERAEGDEYVQYYPVDSSKVIGIKIDLVWPLQWADGLLKEWDVITHADGEPIEKFLDHPLVNWGLFMAGREYVLTVRRYKNIEEIKARGAILPSKDKEYETLKIKAKVEWKDAYRVNQDKVEQIKKNAWVNFVALCEKLYREEQSSRMKPTDEPSEEAGQGRD